MRKRLLVAVAAILALGVLSTTPTAQDYYKAISTAIVSGIATTTTDGFAILNNTPATVGTTVQMSPRLKWCGGAYNSVSTLSETDCFFIEDLPATAAGTTSATFRIGYINSVGTVTYPFNMTNPGNVTLLGNLTAGTVDLSVLSFNSATRGRMFSPADGQLDLMNAAQTIGAMVKVDALPTVASGFGTSPSITAGSTAYAMAVNVGTGGTATTGVINFNGTAFPSAPFCTATPTTSNVVQRISATTTQVTLTVSTAWTASDVIFVQCISPK